MDLLKHECMTNTVIVWISWSEQKGNGICKNRTATVMLEAKREMQLRDMIWTEILGNGY